jgi:hypothetical protein
LVLFHDVISVSAIVGDEAAEGSNSPKLRMEKADLIWNRATMENGGKNPCCGDIALSSLLHAHGLIMNGGVLNAVELLTADELSAAQDGFRFFGLDAAAELLLRSCRLVTAGGDLSADEPKLDAEYAQHIPDDSALYQVFGQRLRSCPNDFSPL